MTQLALPTRGPTIWTTIQTPTPVVSPRHRRQARAGVSRLHRRHHRRQRRKRRSLRGDRVLKRGGSAFLAGLGPRHPALRRRRRRRRRGDGSLRLFSLLAY